MKTGQCITGIMLFSLLWAFCAPLPTEINSQQHTIKLSLEQQGRDYAEFSGEPITAIVELSDSVLFNTITWRTGMGNYTIPENTVGSKATTFKVNLFWRTYPLRKDTSDNCFYDTIYVSTGGNLNFSNQVRVKVSNLPVVVDSATVGSTTFSGRDLVWSEQIDASVSSIPIRIYARDLDGKVVQLSYSGNKGTIMQSTSNQLQLTYETPGTEFKDSISFIIYDRSRGQEIRTLILWRLLPNVPPVIDSMHVADTSMSGMSSIYRVAFRCIDTLRFRAFAHDPNGTVTRYTWKAGVNSRLKQDSTAKNTAIYICTTRVCLDSNSTDVMVIDTIFLTVFDNRGDSTMKKIEINRGTIKHPPQIKSMYINSQSISLNDTIVSYNAASSSQYQIKLNLSNTNSDNFSVSYSGIDASRLSGGTDTGIVYFSPAFHDTDTLTISVTQNELITTQHLVFMVNDIVPVFDSLTVADTVFKGDDSIFFYRASQGQSFLMIIHARDLDSKDTLRFTWSATNPALLNLTVDNRSKIVLPDTVYRDTIIVTMIDGNYKMTKKVSISGGHVTPFIESIQINNKNHKGDAPLYHDTAGIGDQLKLTCYVRDEDIEDRIAISWGARDKSRFFDGGADSIWYQCGKNPAVDTLSVTAEDSYGNRAQKKIELTVLEVTVPQSMLYRENNY